jgi:predicted  nucleic acid-binding Zn-ribbon protein
LRRPRKEHLVSIAATLDVLRALQLADDGLRALGAELEVLPRRVAALREDVAAVSAQTHAEEKNLEAIRKRRRDVERDIATADQSVIKFETDKTKVKTNEEFWALNHQIAGEKKKKSDLEDQVLLLFEEEEGALQKLKRLKDELAGLTQRAVEREKEMTERAAADRTRLGELGAERARLVAKLDEKLLARYEAVRARKAGTAVVLVVRGACGGCHTQQPPQKLNEIRKQDALHTCDFCGRFLLWTPEEAPTA